jgi:hypothetical protein
MVPQTQQNQAVVAATAAVQDFLKANDLPISGVTILGGKPYVNSTGLLVKAKKIGMKGVRVEMLKTATKSDLSASAKATVEMMDGSTYEDFGFTSVDSVQMSSLHNADYLNMMAVTRAKNRALRSATGVGLVSAEEVKDAAEMYSGEDAPKLALPAPVVDDTAKVEGLANLRDTLTILGKDEKKMLQHYSGVWSRALTSMEDLTAADVEAIMVTLRPALAAKAVSPKEPSPEPEPSPKEAPEETKAIEVEVMPEKSAKEESAAAKAMRKGRAEAKK